jgi:LysM repeat protein
VENHRYIFAHPKNESMLLPGISMRILLLAIFGFVFANGQKSEKTAAYIQAYRQLAIDEQKRTGVPAAITLAQGLHESGMGEGPLALKSNNHFGIKCKNTWTGDKVYHDDDARGECFRAYPSVEHSYRDHSDFLKNNTRYSALFMLDPTDYTGWAYGLKKAGYATNPKYADLLIKTIEENNLAEATILAMRADTGGNNLAAAEKEEQEDVRQIQLQPQSIDAQAAPDQLPASLVPEVTYPPGVFTINGCRVIYAEAGTSLLSLATEHKISLSDLLAFNDLKTGKPTNGPQLFYLEKKKKRSDAASYTVANNESLWLISQKTGVRLTSLLEMNNLENDTNLPAGTTLALKPTQTDKNPLSRRQP